MNSKILKNIYFQTCCDELKVFKPGNHSLFSSLPGMSGIKFKYAAKISSEYLTNKKLSLGEAVFNSAQSCKTQYLTEHLQGIKTRYDNLRFTCREIIENWDPRLSQCNNK